MRGLVSAPVLTWWFAPHPPAEGSGVVGGPLRQSSPTTAYAAVLRSQVKNGMENHARMPQAVPLASGWWGRVPLLE
jgi:hypothetical protein